MLDQNEIDREIHAGLTETQHTAFALYDQGLNVFPQPYKKKGGYPWQRLQYIRLNRDHEAYGLKTLFAGRCNLAIMCGQTSDNLFVIDCETPQAFAYHRQQIQQRNIPLWAVKTGRGGHIYLKSIRGEVHSIESGQIADTEIKGRRGYVLGASSRHPNGSTYQWVSQQGEQIPRVDPNQIDWLQDIDGCAINLNWDETRPRKRSSLKLSRKQTQQQQLCYETQDYIKHGHSIPEGTRNNRLFKAACDLAGNDYTQSEAEALLMPVAGGSGLGQGEIQASIHSAYSRQRGPTRPEQPKNPQRHWHYALLWALTHEWQGRGRNTEQAIFLALTERARMGSNENNTFRASIREIAELARVGTATVQKTLQHFVERKMIIARGKDKVSGARLWQFTDYVIKKGQVIELKSDTLPEIPQWKLNSVSLFNSDLLEKGALSLTGLMVYHFLRDCDMPLMPSLISTRTGISRAQVNYNLARLNQYGLVLRHVDGWLAVHMPNDELIAHVSASAGTRGKGDERRQRFIVERQLHAGKILYRARRRHERGHFERSIMVQMRAEMRQRRPITQPKNNPEPSVDGLVALLTALGGIKHESRGPDH